MLWAWSFLLFIVCVASLLLGCLMSLQVTYSCFNFLHSFDCFFQKYHMPGQAVHICWVHKSHLHLQQYSRRLFVVSWGLFEKTRKSTSMQLRTFIHNSVAVFMHQFGTQLNWKNLFIFFFSLDSCWGGHNCQSFGERYLSLLLFCFFSSLPVLIFQIIFFPKGKYVASDLSELLSSHSCLSFSLCIS